MLCKGPAFFPADNARDVRSSFKRFSAQLGHDKEWNESTSSSSESFVAVGRVVLVSLVFCCCFFHVNTFLLIGFYLHFFFFSQLCHMPCINIRHLTLLIASRNGLTTDPVKRGLWHSAGSRLKPTRHLSSQLISSSLQFILFIFVDG